MAATLGPYIFPLKWHQLLNHAFQVHITSVCFSNRARVSSAVSAVAQSARPAIAIQARRQSQGLLPQSALVSALLQPATARQGDHPVAAGTYGLLHTVVG